MRAPVSLLAWILPALPLYGQGERSEDAAPTPNAWVDEREAEFAEYRFQSDGPPGALTMEPGSILNWSNPERGTDSGALFLWTAKGRPEMIACAFEWGGSMKHEFHSLSTAPIEAHRRDAPVHRFAPGVEFKRLPEAPPPATRRALRLTQMRRLAERFRVTVGNKEWSGTRLLPQPVYRSPESLADDVAVFVFVQGTDPECTLLLEATPENEWRYALARQTKWGLKAELDGTPVWEAAAFGRLGPQSPFLVLPQSASPPVGR